MKRDGLESVRWNSIKASANYHTYREKAECTCGRRTGWPRAVLWDMNWLSYTFRGVKDCVKHPGMPYWAWAVKDIGNNSLHAKHAKDSLRGSFSLSFQPCLYAFIIIIMAMSKTQLWSGWTAQSTLQRQKKGEFLLHWSCSNCSKWGWQSAATWGVGTRLGEQNVFCAFSSFLSNDFFCLFNHILWLKSQSLPRASSRTHSSLKKATNQTHKTTWKPSFFELQRNPAWIHLWQLTAAKLQTDSSLCSENPAACLWMLFEDFPVSSDARITLVNCTPEQTLGALDSRFKCNAGWVLYLKQCHLCRSIWNRHPPASKEGFRESCWKPTREPERWHWN